MADREQDRIDQLRNAASAMEQAAKRHSDAAEWLFVASWLRHPSAGATINVHDDLVKIDQGSGVRIVGRPDLVCRLRAWLADELERDADAILKEGADA